MSTTRLEQKNCAESPILGDRPHRHLTQCDLGGPPRRNLRGYERYPLTFWTGVPYLSLFRMLVKVYGFRNVVNSTRDSVFVGRVVSWQRVRIPVYAKIIFFCILLKNTKN